MTTIKDPFYHDEITCEDLVEASKIPLFLDFQQDEKRWSLIKWMLAHPQLMAIALDLRLPELELIYKEELWLWKVVLEKLLFIHNHKSNYQFNNITLTTLLVNGSKRIGNCIVLFNARPKRDGTNPPGYRKVKNLWYVVPTKTLEPNLNDGIVPDISNIEERIFKWITNLLNEKNFSVRRVNALWTKQWQARIIYSKASELWLFEIHPKNQNEKIYHEEKFELLTKDMVLDILAMDNPT